MTSIKRFKSKWFRKLTDIEILFSTGLNVIQSPNEAGKSSLLRGLLQVFYEDATTRKREILSQKSWNADNDDEFFIEVELEDSQGSYIVKRDFQQKRNSIKLPDGKTLEDKKAIEERLGELLGFPSRKGYLATACIMQEELRQVGNGVSELRSLIEERLLQGTRLEEFLKELEKENKDLEKSGEKDPGSIKKLEKELKEQNERRNTLNETRKETSQQRNKLEEVSAEIKELDKKRNDTKDTLTKLEEYLGAKKGYDQASKNWDDANTVIRKREEADKNLTDLGKKLEDIKREINLYEKKIHQFELQNDITNLRHIREEKEKIERKLASIPKIDEEHFRSAEGIPREISSLKSSFQTQKELVKKSINRLREAQKRISDSSKLLEDYKIRLGELEKRLEYARLCKEKEEICGKIRNLQTLTPEMEFILDPQKSLPLRVEVDGKITHDNETKAIIKESAKKQLKIFIKDVIGVEVIQKGVEVKKLFKELEELQSKITNIDDQLQRLIEYATTPEEYKTLQEKKVALEKELKQINEEINNAKGVVEEGNRNIRDGRKGWGGIFAEVQRKRSEEQKIFSRYKVQNLQELRGIKKSYEELKEKMKEKDIEYNKLLNNRTFEQIGSELTHLTTELRKEGQQLIQTPEELNEIKRKKETLQGNAKDLEENISEKRGVLKGLEDPVTLKRKKDAAIKEMEVSEAKVEKLGFPEDTLKDSQFYHDSITQRTKLKKALEELNNEFSDLDKQKHGLEVLLADKEKDTEDIQRLEEVIAAKEKELERHKRRLQVNNVLAEYLREAKEYTVETIPQTLSQKAGHYISFITSNRYNKVDMTNELNVRVFSDEKRDWIDMNEKPSDFFSTGILDQLYFIIRLALIEVIAQKQHPPILMDDPFVCFDPDRTERAIKILEDLSQRYQILIFTCHDYPWIKRCTLNQELSSGIKVFSA